MMRKTGSIAGRIVDKLKGMIKPGISTADIDKEAERLILLENALPAFKGYKGFPAAVCASINEEIVHGIPGERLLREADILSLDLGVNYHGYFSDVAFTVPVGAINPRAKKLLDVTAKALFEGIKQAKAGNYLSNISCTIQNLVENNGFSVVRQFVGHGIGKQLHEEPEIPNFGRPDRGAVLKAGMVLAIEPMVNMGTWECVISDNGWTASTKDGKLSAHFEHTVIVTETQPEIITN